MGTVDDPQVRLLVNLSAEFQTEYEDAISE